MRKVRGISKGGLDGCGVYSWRKEWFKKKHWLVDVLAVEDVIQR